MKNKWILTVLVIGLVLRLLTLNNALSFDEFVQTQAVLHTNEYGLELQEDEYPEQSWTEMVPLTTWTRLIVTGFLGVHIWSLRLTSLIFAALTIWLLFLLAKELYGKKAAYWSAALLSLSAWHALVSTSISFDGAFLTFYTLLAMYLFVRYEKSREQISASETRRISWRALLGNKWLILCGVAVGLTTLTKHTGPLVFIALLLYAYLRTKDLKKITKEFFIIWLAGAATFSIFPIIVSFTKNSDFFWRVLLHRDMSAYFVGTTINLPLLAIQFALMILWMGPLLLFGYFLSWKNKQKQDWLSHSLIFVIIAFYIFIVQDPFRPVERYFTIFLPALCLLVGKHFASLKINKQEWKLFGITFGLFVLMNFAINTMQAKILPFYPKTQFINAVLSFNWNFLVPFTGDQGPVGLYVNFLVFALAFIASIVCFVLVLKKKKLASVFLLAIGLALSVFMMTEMALHPTSPDISSVVKDTASFVKSQQLPGPFYTFRDYAMQYHIESPATNIDFADDPSKISAQLSNGGTLVVIDFPALNKEGELWKVFTQCEQQKVIEEKDLPLGYVFTC